MATNGSNGVHKSNGTNVTNGNHDTNGINGRNGSYSVTHTSSWNSKHPEMLTPSSEPQRGTPAPLAKAQHHKPLKADREGVTAAMSQFSQLVHAPRNPLPTQNGTGTASVKRTQTGLRVDLKYIGWKGTYLCIADGFCSSSKTDTPIQMSRPSLGLSEANSRVLSQWMITQCSWSALSLL